RPLTETNPARHRGPVACAKWCAAVGAFVVGSAVFYYGYCEASPPPPPPGTVACGTEALGRGVAGAFLLGAGPFAALSAGVVGFAIGTKVDDYQHERGQTNPSAEWTGPGSQMRQDDEM